MHGRETGGEGRGEKSDSRKPTKRWLRGERVMLEKLIAAVDFQVEGEREREGYRCGRGGMTTTQSTHQCGVEIASSS